MGPIHPVWTLAAIHPRWGNRTWLLLVAWYLGIWISTIEIV